MHIGLLETGRPPVGLAPRHGSYVDMISSLLGDHDPYLDFTAWSAANGDLPVSPREADVWILTGSADSVTEQRPWMVRLSRFALSAAAAGRRVVGICFGHQLLAQAHGGRVEAAAQGWGIGVHRYTVHRTASWMDPPLSHIRIPVSHHDQVVVPPPDAEILAGNDFCPNGMLLIGDHTLTLQNHPEFSRAFARDLYLERRDRIGHRAVDAALATLEQPVDSTIVGGWLLDFLAGSSSRRALPGYQRFEFTQGELTFPVFRSRKPGPGIVLLHELPGLSHPCIAFANRLVEAGFRVYMPLFYGQPGQKKLVLRFLQVCISRLFRVFAARGGGPIPDWLRALARKVHGECGGPGIGAIGMCLTGNYAIGMMAEPAVIAPVAAQPSLPLTSAFGQPEALALSDDELAAVKKNASGEHPVLGFRFDDDFWCPRAKFDRLSAELGDGFRRTDIEREYWLQWRHAVFTDSFVGGDPNLPTQQALRTLIDHMRSVLMASGRS